MWFRGFGRSHGAPIIFLKVLGILELNHPRVGLMFWAEYQIPHHFRLLEDPDPHSIEDVAVILVNGLLHAVSRGELGLPISPGLAG